MFQYLEVGSVPTRCSRCFALLEESIKEIDLIKATILRHRVVSKEAYKLFGSYRFISGLIQSRRL